MRNNISKPAFCVGVLLRGVFPFPYQSLRVSRFGFFSQNLILRLPRFLRGGGVDVAIFGNKRHAMGLWRNATRLKACFFEGTLSQNSVFQLRRISHA